MAADVLVRRCRLRIARRGGWSWGPDPRALLRGVLLRLPQLLAARLGDAWPDDAHLVLAQAVRLRVTVTRQELAALALAGPADAGMDGPATTAAILRRIDAQVQDWTARAAPSARAPAAGAPRLATPLPSLPADAPIAPWGSAVLAVLRGWHAQGSLVAQLLAFSVATLSDWHEALLRAAAPPAGSAAAPRPATIARLVAEAAALALPLPASPRARLLRRIACMVQAADELGLACGDVRLLDVMAVHPSLAPTTDLPDSLPASPQEVNGSAPAAPGQRDPGAPRVGAPAAAAAMRAVPRRPVLEVEVASALPFLLLGPLARTGFLLTLRATFEAAGIAAQLPCFALALAHKALAPPRRGWLRSAPSLLAARAFAGRIEDPPDGDLAALAHRLTPHLGPLDATVADVLARGHQRGQPLVLRETPDDGWLLLDADGLFPIAWAERMERLFARLSPLREHLLLLPDSPAAGTAMQALDDAGLRFLSDAAPARGQAWRALHAPGQGFASNDQDAGDAPLLSAAQRLDGLGAAADGLWQALVRDRPGLPVGAAPAVERSLALAAALGLGTIAWTLWHGREPVTPQLALERFADFGARISFRGDGIEVRLPLGRRFLDLEAAGLLADVPDVPWFDGRPLRFARG